MRLLSAAISYILTIFSTALAEKCLYCDFYNNNLCYEGH